MTACGGGSDRPANPWTEAPQGGASASAALPTELKADPRRRTLSAAAHLPDATALFDGAERAFPQYFPGRGSNQTRIVEGLVSVATVFTGSGYDVALRSDGSLWLWGLDQGGLKTSGGGMGAEWVRTPTAVPGLPPSVQASTCNAILSALAADGTAWITPGKRVGDRRPPQQVGGLGVVSNHAVTLVVTAGGELWGWGTHNGELDGTAFGERRGTRMPTRVPGFARIVDVHHGCGRIVALREDGALLLSPGFDSLATGGATRPEVLAGLDGIVALGSGYADRQACGVYALRADGGAWLVKAGDFGLGNSATRREDVPALADVSCSFVKAAACVARARDGCVWSWGLRGLTPELMHAGQLAGARQATASGHVVLGDGRAQA